MIYIIIELCYSYTEGLVVKKKQIISTVMFILAALCLCGSCKVLLDDGKEKQELVLNRPEKALYLPHEFWREIFDFEKGTVVMAIADAPYDESDYIRDYDAFFKMYGKDGNKKAQ